MADFTDSHPSIDRLSDLQQLVADFAQVLRVPHLANTGRQENDVEHSFSLAITCWFLAPKIAPELNLEKVFKYALAHDLVEIHAGDTFLFGDEDKLASKSDREDDALVQLVKDWPDFPELATSAQSYKDKSDEEAKFVYAVDKILPVLMVNLGEKSDFWNKHKITEAKMRKKKEKTMTASQAFAPYFERLIAWMNEHDYFYKEPTKS